MNIPKLKPVDSSNIEAIGYNRAQNALFVLFKTKALYRYDGVDTNLFSDFDMSDSKGHFLNNKIKRNFKATVIDKSFELNVSINTLSEKIENKLMISFREIVSNVGDYWF